VLEIVINACVAGLAVGSVYGLIAIGYTVVFNGTRIFNLAQGDLVMAAVMLSYFTLVTFQWPFWLAFLAVIAAVSGLALLEERIIVRPFLKRKQEGHNIGWFIATLAFGVVLQGIAVLTYGHNPPLPIPSPLPSEAIRLGFVHISPQQLLAIVAFIGVCAGLQAFYSRTWLGRSMKATSVNRPLAMLRGIDVTRVSRLSFLIAGLVAAIGGIVVGPIVFADATVGLNYSIKGFIALALGGFGSMRGAVIGALGLGVVEQLFIIQINPSYELTVSIGLLLLVLLLKPTGLFGTMKAREV
jgi:branched-chain amino acid transport system permease protein